MRNSTCAASATVGHDLRHKRHGVIALRRRQALALGTFVRLILRLDAQIGRKADAAFVAAMQTCSHFAVGQTGRLHSSLCRWDCRWRIYCETPLVAKLLPMVWDFCESVSRFRFDRRIVRARATGFWRSCIAKPLCTLHGGQAASRISHCHTRCPMIRRTPHN